MKGSELSVRALDGDMQPPGSDYNWGSRYQQDLQRARHLPCTNRTCFFSLQSRMEINPTSFCSFLTPVNSQVLPIRPQT